MSKRPTKEQFIGVLANDNVKYTEVGNTIRFNDPLTRLLDVVIFDEDGYAIKIVESNPYNPAYHAEHVF